MTVVALTQFSVNGITQSVQIDAETPPVANDYDLCVLIRELQTADAAGQ